MIEHVMEQWHRFVTDDLPEGLESLLADDVVFYSPVVYTPQAGKDLTSLYLHAAKQTLAGDSGSGAFRYTKTVMSGDTVVLEFETTLDGTYVNGVDIIRCNEDGRIVEFRVMIRPLKAINALHEQMRAMLAAMQAPQG